MVPPAWTDVWFCIDPEGHIQATGRDAKGRKQYRYHAEWQHALERRPSSNRSSTSAIRCRSCAIGSTPTWAGATFRSNASSPPTVWLLDNTLIRIGNAEYSKDSYGLTTLLDEHVDVSPTTLHFRFVGKSGKPHDVVLSDRRVARIVAKCQDLPGQQLLQYVADDDVRRVGFARRQRLHPRRDPLGVHGQDIPDLGWERLHAQPVARLGPPESETQAKIQTREAIKATAALLRNTATVCRQSYIHPTVVEAHADGRLHGLREPRLRNDDRLSPDELRLMALLEPDG